MSALRKKVLISLHGLNTRGEWQKNLSSLVSSKGWTYYPLDYGTFRIWKYLLGVTHQKKVNWLRSEVEKIRTETACEYPSIVVHSFGSLLLSKLLEKCHDIHFDKIVLTGSVVRRDYPWKEIRERNQVSAIMNIVGGKDWVSSIATLAPWTGAGNSGIAGFSDSVKQYVDSEIVYPKFDHRDAHYREVFRKEIVPFLERTGLGHSSSAENYLTYVNPLSAACWTTVTYIRQYVDRFDEAKRRNDFNFRDENETQLETPPRKLVILVPDSPFGASKDERTRFERAHKMQQISFLEKGRSALLGHEGNAYDIPSALESFQVYSDALGETNSAEQAIDDFYSIMKSALQKKYVNAPDKPELVRLSDFITKEGE